MALRRCGCGSIVAGVKASVPLMAAAHKRAFIGTARLFGEMSSCCFCEFDEPLDLPLTDLCGPYSNDHPSTGFTACRVTHITRSENRYEPSASNFPERTGSA